MDKIKIEEILKKAVKNLLESQKDFFEFTSATNQTEWNITHHYSSEIQKVFHDYSCDVDISKPNLENKRPDIVVHKRGNHDHNFLIVEVKRKRQDVEQELDKIKSFWFQSNLKYDFGAIVVINDYEESIVRVIVNENK